MVRMSRMRRGLIVVAFLVALIPARSFSASSSPSSSHSSAGWTLRYQPLRIVNGSPVVVRVTTPRPVSELTGKWLGHELAFTFDGTSKIWLALAGASLETKPGSYPMELQGKTSAGQALSFTKEIPVQRKRYPRTVLKVPERYTAPSPEDQREIEQDKKEKEEAFKTLSPEREWSGSLSPPVTSEISEIF